MADCDGYKLEQTVTVTVDKAGAVCTDAPVANTSLSYTGSPQALITAGTVVGGTMQYQLDGGGWSTTIPTAENIGTYHIRYKVVGDANHNDSAEAELTVHIAKAAPAVSTDLTASVTYGDAVKAADIKGAMCNASGLNVAGTFEWENVTDYGDATGENETHTLYATFIPADTSNYDCASHLPVAVTVAKAGYTGTTAADGSAKYGASNTVDLSGLVMSGGKAVIADSGITDDSRILNGTPTIEGATLTFALVEDDTKIGKTATVTVNVSDCTNYTDYTITVTLTVNDKNVPTVTAPAAKTLTYNGADQVLIEAAETTGGTAPAPSEKPTDKPDQEPANKPTIDRNELLQTANRLTYQIMYRLPLPMFPRVMWSWLSDFKFFI